MTEEEYKRLIHLLLVCGTNDKRALDSGNLSDDEWLEMKNLIKKYQNGEIYTK